MVIDQLVFRLVTLILALSLSNNTTLIDEIMSTQLELKNIAIRSELSDLDASELEYHDNAWFSGNILVYYPPGNEDTIYSIPEGTVAIMPLAFHYNDKIRQIICPDSLLYIGSEAFAQTTLATINLDSVLLIGSSAFEGTDLTSVSFSEEIKWIDSFAFYGIQFEENTHVRLPSTLMYIGDDIIVTGTSAWDTWEPVYEVVPGSYAYEWAEENGYDYLLIESK